MLRKMVEWVTSRKDNDEFEKVQQYVNLRKIEIGLTL
jgi:hypothetical protein